MTKGASSTQSTTVPPSASNAAAQYGPQPATPMRGQSQPRGYAYPQHLRDSWNVGAVTALTAITLDFYGNWFTAKVAEDSDISCDGDVVSPLTTGKKVASILLAPFAAYVTNAVLKRLTQYAPRYGLDLGEDECGKAAAAYVISFVIAFVFNRQLGIFGVVIGITCLYIWAKTLVTKANSFAQAYNARIGL